MKAALQFLIGTLALAVGAAATFSGGCGSKAPEPGAATVKGRVVLNGQPVVGGLVVFTPNPERGATGNPAFAETGPDGAYALQFEHASAIPPGWYRVSLAPPPPVAPKERGAVAFPATLARPDLSGLEREVVSGKEHVFEFVIEVPKE
ncbi:MAG TPA: hypothetical protein VGE74_31210 [Gemmata sp.]